VGPRLSELPVGGRVGPCLSEFFFEIKLTNVKITPCDYLISELLILRKMTHLISELLIIFFKKITARTTSK